MRNPIESFSRFFRQNPEKPKETPLGEFAPITASKLLTGWAVQEGAQPTIKIVTATDKDDCRWWIIVNLNPQDHPGQKTVTVSPHLRTWDVDNRPVLTGVDSFIISQENPGRPTITFVGQNGRGILSSASICVEVDGRKPMIIPLKQIP